MFFDIGEWLEQAALLMSRRMVSSAYVSNARNWKQASKVMGGQRIYNALQSELTGKVGHRFNELVMGNAELIKSLPLDVAKQVVSTISREAIAGTRISDTTIRAELNYVARWKAQLIARTETSKASSALTRARAEDLDLNWYVWRTSSDQRVRLSHRKMADVLIGWTTPPSPEQLAGEKSNLGRYNAGDAPNCRCYAEPLLRFDQVSWPHRVYFGNRIYSMTLAQFQRIGNTHQPLAA